MVEQNTHLKNLVRNKEQFEAVRAFFLRDLDFNTIVSQLSVGPTNQDYGERLKALSIAKTEIDRKFEEMEELLEKPKEKKETNPMR